MFHVCVKLIRAFFPRNVCLQGITLFRIVKQMAAKSHYTSLIFESSVYIALCCSPSVRAVLVLPL
jgi:hypothetical protein